MLVTPSHAVDLKSNQRLEGYSCKVYATAAHLYLAGGLPIWVEEFASVRMLSFLLG